MSCRYLRRAEWADEPHIEISRSDSLPRRTALLLGICLSKLFTLSKPILRVRVHFKIWTTNLRTPTWWHDQSRRGWTVAGQSSDPPTTCCRRSSFQGSTRVLSHLRGATPPRTARASRWRWMGISMALGSADAADAAAACSSPLTVCTST